MKKLRKSPQKAVRNGVRGSTIRRRPVRRRPGMRRSSTKKAMQFRQSLFWDVDVKMIDPEKHRRYVIERILDFGNDEEVHWMWHYYGKKLIADVVKNSRVLHEQTRSLWTLLVK